MKTVTEDGTFRNALLDRVRRRERLAQDLFRDVLVAPSAQLTELEGLVREMEGGTPERVGS